MRGFLVPRAERATRGFTLVELLAVIAIVIILLSLLIPAMGGIRDRAETVICAGQLRQLITASAAFTGDHDGEYPDVWRWVWSDLPGSGDWVEWSQPETVPSGQLYSNYMARESRAFLCPSFRRTVVWNPAFSHLTPYVSYSMNEYLWTDASYKDWAGRSKVHRSQIISPASLGIFGEENSVLTPWSTCVLNNLCLGVGPYTGGDVDTLATFHNIPAGSILRGKSNVAYGDGHVKTEDSINSKAIFTPAQYKN